MSFSKRNPLLRNNMEEFNNVIGSLGEEIKEQDLDNVNGGSTMVCVTISATASSASCVAASTAVASLIGGAYTWVNDKVTAKYGCGGVFTATYECFGC